MRRRAAEPRALPLEIFDAVRLVRPSHKLLAVHISASDWPGECGFAPDEVVQLSRWLDERGCDLVDVSSARKSPESPPIYGRMYQVPFAEKVRYAADIPVMAVGAKMRWMGSAPVVSAMTDVGYHSCSTRERPR